MRTKHVALLALILLLPWLSACTESGAMPTTFMGGGTPVAGGATDYTADANCMGAWLMTSSGDESDVSGEGITLTESGGDIPTSATVPPGYSGTSRDFEFGDSEGLEDGDNNAVDINGVDQDMSIVAWIKMESSTTGILISKYTSGGDERQYQVVYNTSGDIFSAYISSDGTSGNTTTCTGASNDYDDTNWHHIGVVYNDTDIRIYQDGVLDGNGINPIAHTAGINNSTTNFCISGYFDQSVAFDGLIDEVAIFDRALSAAEVLEIKTYGIDGTKGGND